MLHINDGVDGVGRRLLSQSEGGLVWGGGGGEKITVHSYGGRVEGEDYCPNLTGCGVRGRRRLLSQSDGVRGEEDTVSI